MAGRLLHSQAGSRVQASAARDGDSRAADGEDFRQVEATVFALIPEYHQVKVRARDGHVYSLTERTRGVRLDALREGQRLACKVTRRLPRVVSAEVLA
jgi:hypothetical protein